MRVSIAQVWLVWPVSANQRPLRANEKRDWPPSQAWVDLIAICAPVCCMPALTINILHQSFSKEWPGQSHDTPLSGQQVSDPNTETGSDIINGILCNPFYLHSGAGVNAPVISRIILSLFHILCFMVTTVCSFSSLSVWFHCLLLTPHRKLQLIVFTWECVLSSSRDYLWSPVSMGDYSSFFLDKL